MKTIFRFIAPMAVAALALSACQRESVKNQEIEGSQIIRVHATAQDLANEDTRTYIDTYNDTPNTILWGTGEYMKLCVTSVADGTTENKWANSTDDSADLYDGEPEALFEFSVSPQDAPSYLYQGLYPASAAVNSNNDNPANYKVNLIATQNATASSYDPAAYIMVAKPETFDEVETDWEASYRRATALNKITLKNVPAGVSIKRVTITVPSEKYLAGARHIDLSTGESGDIYNGGGRTETVEVKYETPLAGGANMDVWFTSWDVEVEAGETLTIVAFTTDKKSYTKTITVPENNSIKFQEGYLNKLTANMSGIDPQDVTELEEGNYLILAKDGTVYHALKAETAGSNADKIASVVYEGSLESYTGDADMVWTVSKSDGSYIIANGSDYVGWSSGNTAEFKVAGDSWTTTNYLIDITWNSANNCYYATLKSDSTRKLQKNSSTAYFAFYTSTQKDQLIFVPATVDTRAELVLSFENPTITLTTDNYVDFEGQYATAYSDGHEVTGLEITYSWDIPEEDSDFGAIDENGFICLGGEVGVTATVTATFEGNETYRPATATYTITVTEASVSEFGWVETAIGDLSSSDVFVMVANDSYALSSAGGSSTNPPAVAVTVSGTKLTGDIADAIKWNISGNSTDGFTFYPDGETTKLFCNTNASTSSNTNLRVGAGGNYNRYLFVLDSDHLKTNDEYTDRYIGINGTSDFRGYVSASTNSCTFKFYKFVAAPDNREAAPISWTDATGTATMSASGISSTLPSLTNTNSLAVSYASSDEAIATIANDGTVSILGAGTTTISATYDGSDSNAPYKTTTVSYTLTVTDNRTACATPTFSPAAGEVAVNSTVTISCATEGATIHYTVDGTTPTPESTVYSSAITIDAAKTIKAIAVKANYKNSEVATAAYTVFVATVGSGTQADPYTAGDILDKYPTGSGDTQVYVTGTITDITEVSTQYGNATYTISDGTRSILVYRGKYLNNESFTSADQIAVDDIVIVYGKIGTHNSVPQLATGNYLISVTKDTTTPTLSVSPASLSWAADETDSKTLTVTLNGSAAADDYTYSVTSGTAAAWTISKNNGTLTVAPNAANTDTDNAKSITIRITHADDNTVYQDVVCTQAKKPSASVPAVGTVMWAETWTGSTTGTSGSSANNASANYGNGTTVYNSGTVTYAQSANSVYVRNENLAGGDKPELMLSSGQTWTISDIPTGGASELSLTYLSNNTKSSVSCSTSGANISGASKSYTISTGGASTITLVFSCSGNTRIDNVSLTVKTQ